MNKAVGIVGASAITAAASAGGIYLYKLHSFDSTLPKDISDFDATGQEEGCVYNTFQGLKDMTPADASANKVDDNFFESQEKKNSTGCLVINWNKENFSNGTKWKGGFRFLGSLQNGKGDKGFIIFAVAIPTNGSKFKWTGNFYALEKKADSNEWKVAKKLSMADEGKDKEVDAKDKFPKSKIMKPQYWGYLSDLSSDLGKLCSNGDCKGDKTIIDFEGYGTWQSDEGSEGVGDWMENLEIGGKETFTESKGKIKELVKDMKGKGTEKVWYGIDKNSTK